MILRFARPLVKLRLLQISLCLLSTDPEVWECILTVLLCSLCSYLEHP